MYCKFYEETRKKNSYTSGCKNHRVSDIQKHAKGHDHNAADSFFKMLVVKLTTLNIGLDCAGLKFTYKQTHKTAYSQGATSDATSCFSQKIDNCNSN